MATTESIREIKTIDSSKERWFFWFFFLSGFCSILYELVWLRLAMARFGVTTATVSIVISCFMAGLGAGSWLGGRFLPDLARRLRQPPIRLYALLELAIGTSAIIFPIELSFAQSALTHLGASSSLTSTGFYIVAGLLLALTIVPWCTLMGATIPLGIISLASGQESAPSRSFSLLYLGNVSGAVLGTLVPLLIIEVRGFSATLLVGMLLNFCIAAIALRVEKKSALYQLDSNLKSGTPEAHIIVGIDRRDARVPALWLLFLSGLTSMGLEVVWVRIYTPFVGNVVYSFSTILGVYLAATFSGSIVYRTVGSRFRTRFDLVCWLLWLTSLLALAGADERIGIVWWLRVPFGIVIFSAVLGFATPMLVDRYSRGDPRRAGLGYAINVLGCITGPLMANFVLLANISERSSLIFLSLPWLIFGSFWAVAQRQGGTAIIRAAHAAFVALFSAITFVIAYLAHTYVERFAETHVRHEIRRDSTATVIAAGEGFQRRLYVNGLSMTVLSPITKMMGSLPLLFLERPPNRTLTICFGMGTTHRSMLAWGLDSTVVELVPSVPTLFSFFHEDGNELLMLPNSHVVIDDGRRFLERTAGQYDAIVIDPPPPVGAAGSSLLYSEEFYGVALKHLSSGGILQQWFPGGSNTTTASVARALKDSFPFVRAFRAVDNRGIHFLASAHDIPKLSATQLAARLPEVAAIDLIEWGPFDTPEKQLDAVVGKEIPIDALIALDPKTPGVRDDRPVNEYYLLRELAQLF